MKSWQEEIGACGTNGDLRQLSNTFVAEFDGECKSRGLSDEVFGKLTSRIDELFNQREKAFIVLDGFSKGINASREDTNSARELLANQKEISSVVANKLYLADWKAKIDGCSCPLELEDFYEKFNSIKENRQSDYTSINKVEIECLFLEKKFDLAASVDIKILTTCWNTVLEMSDSQEVLKKSKQIFQEMIGRLALEPADSNRLQAELLKSFDQRQNDLLSTQEQLSKLTDGISAIAAALGQESGTGEGWQFIFSSVLKKFFSARRRNT